MSFIETVHSDPYARHVYYGWPCWEHKSRRHLLRFMAS